MLVARSVLALAIVTVLVVPVASALPDEPYRVSSRHRLTGGPLALVAGDVDFDGQTTGLVTGAVAPGTVLARIPELEIAEAGPTAGRTTLRDVDVVVHSGGLFLDRGDAPRVRVVTDPDYALALIPPVEAGSDLAVPGVVFASLGARHLVAAPGGSTTVLPVDAVVTIRDPATGAPVKGWDARRVNAGVRPDSAEKPEGDLVELVAKGAFEGVVVADVALITLARVGETLDAEIHVGESAEPRLEDAFGALGAAEGVLQAPSEALDGFRALEPLLNGAVVLVSAGPDASPATVVADELERPVGTFTLLRTEDLTATFASTDEVALDGVANLMLVENGFVARGRAAVGGVFPVVAVVLWVVAIALVVARFVKKPTAAEVTPGVWRWVGHGVYAVMLLVAFLVFDASFAHAFGGSVVKLLVAGDVDLRALGTIAAFELLPFTLAGVAFALPVRLATGVVLRYTGRAKGWKGYSKAAGALALAVFTPTYALFFLNATVVKLLASALSAAGG